MRVIGIVPDADPDADTKFVEIPDYLSLSGTWQEVELHRSQFIPEGWHMVSLRGLKEEV